MDLVPLLLPPVLLHLLPWLLVSPAFGDKPPLPGFSLSWADDKMDYRAGDVALIKIKPFWGDSDSNSSDVYDKYVSEFSVSVMGKKGDSSFVSGVVSYSQGNPAFWNITFVPITVGKFALVVTEERSGFSDSSLHFSVVAGPIHPSACIASWMNDVNEYVAGMKANVLIFPKDAFGNNISSTRDGMSTYNKFAVAAYHEDGTTADILQVKNRGWDGHGYFGIEFEPATAGSLLLEVLCENTTMRNSPLTLNVKPGALAVSKCLGQWKYEINVLQIFSKLEFFIYQKDHFGNLVPDFFQFDAEVIKKGTNLSIPVADIFFSETEPGIQLLSFVVSEPGEFMLVVFDGDRNERISNAPYEYQVFVGYCHRSNSIINGSGLLASVAGEESDFTVYLEDMYYNPSPAKADKLHIHILKVNDTVSVQPTILPLRNISDGEGPAPTPPLYQNETISGNSTTETSVFSVAYTPEKSGVYEIWAFCGNVPLNNGLPFSMTTSPGLVDISVSKVVEFSPGVKRLFRNEILVKLVDSFRNPIPSEEEKLSLQFNPTNSSILLRWRFVQQEDGLYIGYYLAQELGTYNVCVSFEEKHLSPCPFEVIVHQGEYFPEASNDSISVWEDGSITFDVLKNDHYTGGNVSIINSSTPLHGSLLLYGKLFRYTPYKGFSGNDSFSYAMSDINDNVAVGTVLVDVLCLPPQFVSLPVHLQAIEDDISPKFGGFAGLSIKYSDFFENISIVLSAQSGTILLAPMPLQLWQPLGSKLLIRKMGKGGKGLQLSGCVEVINSALQLIQYLGDENFYGNDILTLCAMNKNGKQDAHVPIYVEPVNDSPFVVAPKFIISDKDTRESFQIFNKERGSLESSIWDPDLLYFPGNKSSFLVTLSMEVNDGILIASLPDDLLHTAELKIKNSYHWQHLQSFVTISNHFTIKGKGIRIRATIEECNDALQKLLYQGMTGGVILTVTVNDMGNYGRDANYNGKISLPHSDEAVIHIIKRRPISSLASRFLGSAIIIEFILMFLLGGVLLFFICKCTHALRWERSSKDFEHREETTTQTSAISPRERTKTSPTSNMVSCERPGTSTFRQRSVRGRTTKMEHQQSSPATGLHTFSVQTPKRNYD